MMRKRTSRSFKTFWDKEKHSNKSLLTKIELLQKEHNIFKTKNCYLQNENKYLRGEIVKTKKDNGCKIKELQIEIDKKIIEMKKNEHDRQNKKKAKKEITEVLKIKCMQLKKVVKKHKERISKLTKMKSKIEEKLIQAKEDLIFESNNSHLLAKQVKIQSSSIGDLTDLKKQVLVLQNKYDKMKIEDEKEIEHFKSRDKIWKGVVFRLRQEQEKLVLKALYIKRKGDEMATKAANAVITATAIEGCDDCSLCTKMRENMERRLWKNK